MSIIYRENESHRYLHVIDKKYAVFNNGELLIKDHIGEIRIPKDRFALTNLQPGVYHESMIDDSVKALNLATNEEVCFDSHTTPVWAVVYGWCQQHNKLSWLFSLTQKRIWQAEFQDKIRYGSATVNMGDWSAVLREADRPEQHAYTKAVLDNVNVSIKRAHQNALGQWVYFVDDGEHTFYINESRLRNFK